MRLITAKRLEAIGQLAGGVAHEINTPLQYVTGNLEFALSNLPRLVGLIDKYEQALFLASGGRELEKARAGIEAYRKEHDLEMVLAELPLALSESHAGPSGWPRSCAPSSVSPSPRPRGGGSSMSTRPWEPPWMGPVAPPARAWF
jgi:hypothetical protein